MATGKITKRAVDALKPGQSLFDDELKGFMVRARDASKTYGVKYFASGRQRIFTIGRHGDKTPEQARTVALEILSLVANGNDPQGAKAEKRLKGRKTFADLAALYFEEYAEGHKKARSIFEDRATLRRYLLPALGPIDVEAISKGDFFKLRVEMRDTPIAFNRARALASKMFALAEKWDLRKEPNPVKHVDKFPENPRTRYLTAEEYARLFAALDHSAAHPSVVACVRLLALTGARLSEILNLRWSWVDFENGVLRLPDSKSGAKITPLADAAIKVLNDLPRVSEYVLPGAHLKKAFVGIQRPWRRIREMAGLPDLRLHDLRHGFASTGAQMGESLKILGGVLGQKKCKCDRTICAYVQRSPARSG